MARRKVVQTAFPGKMKRLVKRGYRIESATQGFLQGTVWVLVKDATPKKEK